MKTGNNLLSLIPSIDLPIDWTLEEENNVISIYNPDNGAGALQVSIYSSDQSVNLFEGLSDLIHNKEPILDYGQRVVNAHYIDDNLRFWEFWLMKRDDFLVFLTYNCLQEDVEKDKQEIRQIVNSILRINPKGPHSTFKNS